MANKVLKNSGVSSGDAEASKPFWVPAGLSFRDMALDVAQFNWGAKDYLASKAKEEGKSYLVADMRIRGITSKAVGPLRDVLFSAEFKNSIGAQDFACLLMENGVNLVTKTQKLGTGEYVDVPFVTKHEVLRNVYSQLEEMSAEMFFKSHAKDCDCVVPCTLLLPPFSRKALSANHRARHYDVVPARYRVLIVSEKPMGAYQLLRAFEEQFPRFEIAITELSTPDCQSIDEAIERLHAHKHGKVGGQGLEQELE